MRHFNFSWFSMLKETLCFKNHAKNALGDDWKWKYLQDISHWEDLIIMNKVTKYHFQWFLKTKIYKMKTISSIIVFSRTHSQRLKFQFQERLSLKNTDFFIPIAVYFIQSFPNSNHLHPEFWWLRLFLRYK